VGGARPRRFGADAGQLAAEDLRGEQAVRAEGDQAAAGDRPLDLDRVTSPIGGSGEGPTGTAPPGRRRRGAPGAFVNQVLKSGPNLNYRATAPNGSSSDLK
jgi:hypothetical protein